MNIADRHQEYELEIKALFARHRVSFTADLDGGAFHGTASGMGTKIEVQGGFDPSGRFSFPADAVLPVGTFHAQAELQVDGSGNVRGTVGEPGKKPLAVTGRRTA